MQSRCQCYKRFGIRKSKIRLASTTFDSDMRSRLIPLSDPTRMSLEEPARAWGQHAYVCS